MSEQLHMLINLAALLLGGTALGVVLRYRTKMRELGLTAQKQGLEGERVTFETLLEELRQQRDEIRGYATGLEQRISQMETEIQGLRLARDLDPFPNWVADGRGEHLYVNREFEKLFLEPTGRSYRDVIGRTHSEIGWPEEFCATLQTLDAAARSRPDGTARAVTALDVPGIGPCRVTVHKFPIRFKPSGIIVAYAGYITDLEPQTQLIGQQAA